MDIRLKQRIIGIAVLLVLIVIVVPLLFTGSNKTKQDQQVTTTIPTPPAAPVVQSSKPVMQVVKEPTGNSIFTPPVKVKPVAKKPVSKPKVVKLIKAKAKKHSSLHSYHHGWLIQLASFDSKVNAGRLVKKLRSKGYSAYVKTAKIGKIFVHRVFVGPEPSWSKTKKLIKVFETKYKLKGMVIRHKL